MMNHEQIKEVYRGHYQLYHDMMDGKILPSEYGRQEKYYQDMKVQIKEDYRK